MTYYLSSRKITRDRYYALYRTGDYESEHVFNSDGRVCGLRLLYKYKVLPIVPLKDSAFNQQDFHLPSVQLSLFDL